MSLFCLARICIGFSILLVSQVSKSATVTAVLPVNATVIAACAVGSSTLAFGTFTPGGAVLNVNGNLSITCTNGNNYTIALNKGSGTGATLANRIMIGSLAPGVLNYTIYTTTARTTVWGDGTASTATVAGTGSGVAQSITVPGQIFAGQATTATPGNYTDTVNITVSF